MSKISDIIGSPDPDNWPSIVDMPDYGKIEFKKNEKKDFYSLFGNNLKKEI